MPHIVNVWRATQKVSPYRIAYGFHNPAMNGLILTTTTIIPNFSWTPHLAVEDAELVNMLQCNMPEDVLVLPAVNCVVVRVFVHSGVCYIADSHNVEQLPQRRGDGGPLSQKFQTCLATHCKRAPWKYVADLTDDRVWFFGLYDEPSRFVQTHG